MRVPAGHSAVAHLLLGSCARCPGTSTEAENALWRAWATSNVPEVDDTLRDYYRAASPTTT